jgi:putative acetyltransferase
VARRDYTQEQVLAWAPDQIDRKAWAARYGDRPAWVVEIAGVPVGFGDLEPGGHLDSGYSPPDIRVI